MAAFVARTAVSLVLLASITGLCANPVAHRNVVRASVGQNVSLPCFDDQDLTVLQVEWKKRGTGEHEEHRLIVYNPLHGSHRDWHNMSVLVREDGKGKLRGAYLHLSEVQVGDGGSYMCDLTTYPQGSIRKVFWLEVRAGPTAKPPLSLNLTETEMTQNGSQTPSLSSVHMSTAIPTDTGTNVTWSSGVHTSAADHRAEPSDTTNAASLSTSLDDITSSSVRPDISPSVPPVTPPLPNQSIDSSIQTVMTTQVWPLSNPSYGPQTTLPPLLQSGSTYPSADQSEPSPRNGSERSTVGREKSESDPETSSRDDGQSPLSPSMSPGNSVLTQGSAGPLSTRSDPPSARSSDPDTSGVITETGPDGTQRYALFVVLPVLGVILLVGALYWRHQVQKRMDLPPSFKPPPPPVKYSSVRNDVPMTDILT